MLFTHDLEKAQSLLGQRRYKHALKAAKSAMKKNPGLAAAPNIAGIALGKLGQHREAATQFIKALKLDPSLSDARRNLAQTQLLLGRPEAAGTVLAPLVELDAADAAAWYLLAQSYLALGHAQEASHAATRAVDVDPVSSRGLVLRAMIRERMGHLVGALADYQAALDRNPNDVDALVAISRPLARQTRYDDALAMVNRAVALDPQHLRARLRLAAHHVETGNITAAIREYHKARTLAPGHAEALEQLSHLQDREANRGLEPQIESALKTAPKRSETRASLFFARARIEEQSGRKAEAARSLAMANRDMASVLPYSARDDAALTEKLLSRFSASQPLPAAECDEPLPIYIVGLPRSGTTLAEAILGAHRNVAPLGERGATGSLLQDLINKNLPFDPEAIQRFVDCDRQLLPDLPPQTRAYVDKMPENYRLVGFIRTAYPHARIINLTRDPRDIALSMWRGHFSGTALNYSYDLAAMAHRFNLYARTMNHWRALWPDSLLDIAYEDIVADITAGSRRIAGFCGLNWTEGMTSPHVHAGQVLTLSATQLRQPVHSRSVGGWRDHADVLAPFIAGLDPGLWPGIDD